MKKIYLIRHGESTSNAGGKMYPNPQIPLTDVGQQQAESVAQWVMQTTLSTDSHINIDSINVSKYLRTQQTAHPLVSITNIAPNIIDGLQEFDFQNFDKVKDKSIKKRVNHANNFFNTARPETNDGGNAESFAEFSNRVAKVREYFENMPDGTHVVYTHGIWISMLIWQLMGQPINTKQSVRKFRQFELSIRAKNCESYLLMMDSSGEFPPVISKARTHEKLLKSRRKRLINRLKKLTGKR